MIVFNEYELKAMPNDPDVLDSMANLNSVFETMSSAIGEPFNEITELHRKRVIELRTEAQRLRKEYDES